MAQDSDARALGSATALVVDIGQPGMVAERTRKIDNRSMRPPRSPKGLLIGHGADKVAPVVTLLLLSEGQILIHRPIPPTTVPIAIQCQFGLIRWAISIGGLVALRV